MTENMLNSTITGADSTTSTANQDKYQELKIISAVTVTAAVALTCIISYIIYRRFCRGVINKHGVERDEVGDTPKNKREYFDQFGCDTNELTVNSVTALRWDEDEKTPWANSLQHSRSSGIDVDTTSIESKDVQRINTGKKVFQVNKVSEAPRNSVSPHQPRVIRIPKGLANAARSLQASDGKNFTLAIIDKNSKTIHNIDLRNYRPRTRGKSPLAGEYDVRPHPTSNRRRLHSTGDPAYKPPGTHSAVEMVHDSPDMTRRPRRGTQSAEHLIQDSSTEEGSTSTADIHRATTPSMSSEDLDPNSKLLQNGV